MIFLRIRRVPALASRVGLDPAIRVSTPWDALMNGTTRQGCTRKLPACAQPAKSLQGGQLGTLALQTLQAHWCCQDHAGLPPKPLTADEKPDQGSRNSHTNQGAKKLPKLPVWRLWNIEVMCSPVVCSCDVRSVSIPHKVSVT